MREPVNVIAVWYGDGSLYPADYLEYLQWAFDEHSEGCELRFHVLTDRDDAPPDWRAIPFHQDFNSKLKKLEMFRPDICPGERCVYSDLDNMIVGEIGKVLDYSGAFAIRTEFDNCTGVSPVQSSFMMWRGGDVAYLYDKACAHPTLTESYPIGGGRGDQLFLGEHLEEWENLEDLFPGAFVSYKWGFRDDPNVRERARVVYFHGKKGEKPADIGWAP